MSFNSLPSNSFLDWFKLKALADDKIKVLKMMIFVFDRVENIVGNGKMLVARIFSFSLSVFKGLFTQGWYKSGLCGKGLRQVSTDQRLDKVYR